jgi:hypothetical protein
MFRVYMSNELRVAAKATAMAAVYGRTVAEERKGLLGRRVAV